MPGNAAGPRSRADSVCAIGILESYLPSGARGGARTAAGPRKARRAIAAIITAARVEGARNLARARRPAALILCAARAEAARARGARPSARCCGRRFCRATRARALAHVRRLARASAHTLPRLAPAPGSLPRSRLTSTPTHQPALHPFRSVLRTHPRTQLASSWRAADAPSARIDSHARAQGRAHDT